MFNSKKFAHIFATAFYGAIVIAAVVMFIYGSAKSEWANRDDVNFMAFFLSVCMFAIPGFYYLEREVIPERKNSVRQLIRIIRFALFVVLIFLTGLMCYQTYERGTNSANQYLVYIFTCGSLLNAVLQSIFYSRLYYADQEGGGKNILSILIYASPFVCCGIAALGAYLVSGLVLLGFVAAAFVMSFFLADIPDVDKEHSNAFFAVVSSIMSFCGFWVKLLGAAAMTLFLCLLGDIDCGIAPLVAIGDAIAFLIFNALLERGDRIFDPSDLIAYILWGVLFVACIVTAVLFMHIWWIALIIMVAIWAAMFIFMRVTSVVDPALVKASREKREGKLSYDASSSSSSSSSSYSSSSSSSSSIRYNEFDIARQCEYDIKAHKSCSTRVVSVSPYKANTYLYLDITLELQCSSPSMYDSSPSSYDYEWYKHDCDRCMSWAEESCSKMINNSGFEKIEFQLHCR